MKNPIAFLLLLLSLASCQKNDETNPEPVPTTGNLSFEIFYEGIAVDGALIGLSKDQTVDEESLFLIIKPTDDEGKVFFELEPGAYYWQIKFPEDTQYTQIGGNPRRFIDLGLGSHELEAGDQLGVPVFINE